MEWFFSNSEGGFYPADTLDYCKSVGNLPDDLRAVTDDEHRAFFGVNPDGKIPHFSDEAGGMVWIDRPVTS